ncbi:MAG: PilX N-terminal domain-containing pilus assembly protein [bacterium]|nr:PilX N-terminal domain-containing pilus assembly protein [bacterium]
MSQTNKQEKGIALVMALMLLLVMSVMVAGFMLTITNEQKMGGNQVRYVEALNLAEAGISEVSARLNLPTGDANAIAENTPQNADWEARILNETNLPAAEGNAQYYPALLAGTTNQLSYTVSDINSADAQYVLTARYKTNAAGNAIFFYDYGTGTQHLVNGPPFNAPNDNSFPIWVIRSTGMVGNVRRSVEAEVTRNKVEINVTAAVSCDQAVWATGAFSVCGHNHLMSTPVGTRVKQGGSSNPCHDDGWEVCDRDAAGYAADSCIAGGCLPGITTTGDANEPPKGGGDELGFPVGNSNTGTFKEIWEALGFATEADMRSAYNITQFNTKAGASITDGCGFYEYTGDMTPDGSKANELSISDLPDSSRGILWVRGPFDGVGAGCFKGLLYVDGEMAVSNKIWVLGAVMIKGDNVNYDGVSGNAPGAGRGMHMRGNGDLLYSSEMLQYVMQQISSSSIGLKQISWREIDIHN